MSLADIASSSWYKSQKLSHHYNALCNHNSKTEHRLGWRHLKQDTFELGLLNMKHQQFFYPEGDKEKK